MENEEVTTVLTPGSQAAQNTVATVGQTTAPVPPPGLPPWFNMVFMVGIVLFMWLFVLRPQAKKQKQHKVFLQSLANGMEVVTSSGVVGTIAKIEDHLITLDLGQAKMRIQKGNISHIWKNP